MNSLITGSTGLMAHQQKLDVVANNIANMNTTGFKSQRTLFSDLIYTDFRPAVGPVGTTHGGVNPGQVGNGVQVASIAKNFSQGILESTGAEFDFAIDGDGFFVVGNDQDKFTRDGSFAVDRNGYLVDPGTGLHVQRVGSVGESADGFSFQTAGDSRISIPLGASVPGQNTSQLDLVGNLPVTGEPAIQESLLSQVALTTGGTPATLTTTLNALDVNLVDYQVGDFIDIAGTNADGSSFSLALAADGTTTLGDLSTGINSVLTGATLSLTAAGNLQVLADEPGDSLLSLTLRDRDSNFGDTQFSDVAMIVETDGRDADQFNSTVQIHDGRGTPHTLSVTYEKQGTNTWNATFSTNDPSIQVIDGLVEDIVFREDGGLQLVNGVNLGDANIELQFDDLVDPQTVQLDFGQVTHLATDFVSTYEQDGFSAGNIIAMEVDASGVLSGIATNGRRLDVAQLAIAGFANVQGLYNAGDNFYEVSSSSGEPIISAANAGGRGRVTGGELESSNVDIAFEFTQLIIAQRGFSANARSITVATEVLQELNNIF